MKKKIIYIACSLVFGVVVGFVSIWFYDNTDSIFILNIPGTLIGDGIYTGTIELFGDPHSSQAHYTIPRVFRTPQVYVLASILFWGIAGTLLSIFLEPKITACIVPAYLIIAGILTIVFLY